MTYFFPDKLFHLQVINARLRHQDDLFDASNGIALLGMKSGKYLYMPPVQSGLFVNGEARCIDAIKKAKGGNWILIGMNNAPLYIFERKNRLIR